MFHESVFVSDFINFYDNNNDEYDLPLVFDKYFNNFISNNTEEVNKCIVEHYCTNEQIASIIEKYDGDYTDIAFDILHDILYVIVEETMVDRMESDADTDGE